MKCKKLRTRCLGKEFNVRLITLNYKYICAGLQTPKHRLKYDIMNDVKSHFYARQTYNVQEHANLMKTNLHLPIFYTCPTAVQQLYLHKPESNLTSSLPEP